MPEDSRTDDVEKFLTQQESMEDRKQALIADPLKQREAAIKVFDHKLERFGYRPDSARKTKTEPRQNGLTELARYTGNFEGKGESVVGRPLFDGSKIG